MSRADFVLDVIRTRNVAVAAALVGVFIASRVLIGSRRSAWLVLLFAMLVVALGYALSRLGG